MYGKFSGNASEIKCCRCQGISGHSLINSDGSVPGIVKEVIVLLVSAYNGWFRHIPPGSEALQKLLLTIRNASLTASSSPHSVQMLPVTIEFTSGKQGALKNGRELNDSHGSIIFDSEEEFNCAVGCTK